MTGNARTGPPWWLRLMNTTFIQLSRLGLSYGAEGPVVLTVPGRKTGKPRSTPITPMAVNSSRYVIAGFPGADWVRNARAPGEATLQHGRHTERVRMVELSSEDARPVLRAFPTEVPTGVTFMKRFGLVKDAAPRSSRRLRGPDMAGVVAEDLQAKPGPAAQAWPVQEV